MFYVYQNTSSGSIPIANFEDKENALEFMAIKASENFSEKITGYAVRDYQLKTYAEMEI